jgi:tetratricopeptide (TPR) repeat protein
LVNVALHAASTVLLFLVLRAMTGASWRSGFVAAVFAVHPLRAESVAWIAERKDVLAGLFFMLTLSAYVAYVGTRAADSRRRKFFYALTLVLFALGLLSKNMLVTLPFVLLLLDGWPLGRISQNHNSEARNQNPAAGGLSPRTVPFWALVREKIPFFFLSAGSCVATALVPEHIWSGGHVPALERVENALVSYVTYLRQMAYPAGLAIPYSYPPDGFPIWQTGVALILLAAISAGAVAGRRKRPWFLVGWLWFLGMLVPVIGLAQISFYSHADRYTYLPEIGVAIAVAWAVADWTTAWKYRSLLLGALMLALIGALTVRGRIQTAYWRDSQSLWTHVLACDPGNSVAHNCLGNYLAEQGDKPKAAAEYRFALKTKPDYAEALANLGTVLFEMGEKADAIAHFRSALQTNPDYAGARNSLGVTLFDKGDKAEAIAQYQAALLINPDYAEARNNLGIALFDMGETTEAIAQYRKALENDPNYVKADYNWGNALASEGQLDEAIAHFRRAVKVKPGYTNAWSTLGLVYFQKGDIQQAIDSWQRALQIAPAQPDVQNNLAWLLATTPDAALRNGPRAVALAEQASQFSGGANAPVLHTLAAAYAETGRYRDAAATARRALELAAAQTNADLTARLPNEIILYEAGQPLRDAP